MLPGIIGDNSPDGKKKESATNVCSPTRSTKRFMELDNSNWRKLLGDHPPIIWPGWEPYNIYITTEARDKVYEQLLSLRGQSVIDLVPCDKADWEKYKERTTLPGSYKNWTPEEHTAARKVGSLVDVCKNVDGYIRPVNEIFCTFSIDPKFQDFQWKSYSLFIGLDDRTTKYEYERGADGWTPAKWDKFTIVDCNVRGLYMEKNKSHNDHDFDVGMRNYYHLRTIGMYMYLPGRSYF